MSIIPKRSQYLGRFSSNPTPTEAGQWWYRTDLGIFCYWDGTSVQYFGGGTTLKTVQIPADNFGRPNTNPPTVVDQDNLTLYEFTLDTDRLTYKFPIPYDYDSGPMEFFFVWTNDGGNDDDGTNVRWQLSYQVGSEGDVISGSHANSPKTVDDTYVGALGFVEHHTDWVSIAQADFQGEACVFLMIMAITPTAPALTCDPNFIGMCFRYTAKRFVL